MTLDVTLTNYPVVPAAQVTFNVRIGYPCETATLSPPVANPFVAASRGYVDDVIMPAETRERICRSFAMLRDKQLENPWRKHGNIPL